MAVVCYGVSDCLTDPATYPTYLRGVIRDLKAASVAVTLLSPLCFYTARHPELRPQANVLDSLVDQARAIAQQESVVFADSHALSKGHAENGERGRGQDEVV